MAGAPHRHDIEVLDDAPGDEVGGVPPREHVPGPVADRPVRPQHLPLRVVVELAHSHVVDVPRGFFTVVREVLADAVRIDHVETEVVDDPRHSPGHLVIEVGFDIRLEEPDELGEVLYLRAAAVARRMGALRPPGAADESVRRRGLDVVVGDDFTVDQQVAAVVPVFTGLVEQPLGRGGRGNEGREFLDVPLQGAGVLQALEQAGVRDRVDQGIGLGDDPVEGVHPRPQTGGVDLVHRAFQPGLAAGEILAVDGVGSVRTGPGAIVDRDVPESALQRVIDHLVDRGLGVVDEEVGLAVLPGLPGPHAVYGRMGQAVLDLHLLDDIQELVGRTADQRDLSSLQPDEAVARGHQAVGLALFLPGALGDVDGHDIGEPRFGKGVLGGVRDRLQVERDDAAGKVLVPGAGQAGAHHGSGGEGNVGQLQLAHTVIVERDQFESEVAWQDARVDAGAHPGDIEFDEEKVVVVLDAGRADVPAPQIDRHEGRRDGFVEIVPAGFLVGKGPIRSVGSDGVRNQIVLEDDLIARACWR